MDKGLLYNQSGVKDETAYKAIINLEREETGVTGFEINKGEIWEVESGVGTKMVVVLNCYEKYAATVMLQEQEPGNNAVSVVAHGRMYADAGRLGYVFYDKMVDFVRVLSPDEDRELRKAIGVALDLEVNKVSAATTALALEARDKASDAAQQYENMVAEANREIAGLQYEIEQLRKELAAANEVVDSQAEELKEAENRVAELIATKVMQLPEAKPGYTELVEEHSLREDLAAARREAEIYKGLYERLLDKALG